MKLFTEFWVRRGASCEITQVETDLLKRSFFLKEVIFNFHLFKYSTILLHFIRTKIELNLFIVCPSIVFDFRILRSGNFTDD